MALRHCSVGSFKLLPSSSFVKVMNRGNVCSGKRKAGTLAAPARRKSHKQAIALGLSEARKRGAKVPKKKGSPRILARRPQGRPPWT